MNVYVAESGLQNSIRRQSGASATTQFLVPTRGAFIRRCSRRRHAGTASRADERPLGHHRGKRFEQSWIQID